MTNIGAVAAIPGVDLVALSFTSRRR